MRVGWLGGLGAPRGVLRRLDEKEGGKKQLERGSVKERIRQSTRVKRHSSQFPGPRNFIREERRADVEEKS